MFWENNGTEGEMIKMFIDNSPIAYIIMDRDYRIHYINKSFAKLRNLDSVTTVGKRCYDISNGGVRCENCAVASAMETGKKAFIARKDILPGGVVRYMDDYAVPLKLDEQGNVKFVLEIMVNRTEEMLARERRNKDYDELLTILAGLLEAKDSYTAEHSRNVRTLSLNLAIAMGLPPDDIFEIAVAASLHDIGKVEIPLSILNKPGRLDDEEFAEIKKHPVFSDQMLSGFSSFGQIRNIARHHHERIDGRGYPEGLAGNKIPLGAQIVAVADTYDAMTTTRPYRKALSHEYALGEIRRAAGTQLSGEAVEAFAGMDFENLTDDVYAGVKPGQSHALERILAEVVPARLPGRKTKSIEKDLDLEELLEVIFQNTPCGYVLMDRKQQVYYASDYFLDYMGLAKAEVLGGRCYEAGGCSTKPCPNCCISHALETGKVEVMRQERITKHGLRIFDLYGVPLIDGTGPAEWVIEITIDRTDEVMLEREREEDFQRLMDMLGELLKHHSKETNEEKTLIRIRELRERVKRMPSRIS